MQRKRRIYLKITVREPGIIESKSIIAAYVVKNIYSKGNSKRED